MKFKGVLLAVIMALTGCATCREHPVACSIAGAIVVGSVAATIAANSGHDDSRNVQINPVARPVHP